MYTHVRTYAVGVAGQAATDEGQPVPAGKLDQPLRTVTRVLLNGQKRPRCSFWLFVVVDLCDRLVISCFVVVGACCFDSSHGTGSV